MSKLLRDLVQKSALAVLSVSEVQIALIRPRDGLLAFCSVVLGGQFFVGGIALHSAAPPRHYRLVFPRRDLGGGQRVEYAHPLTKELAQAIEDAVVERYEELIDRLTK